MNYIIGCDAHKHYSQFAVYEGDQTRGKQVRVEHERGAVPECLSEFPEGHSGGAGKHWELVLDCR